jgi:hypothetical protein
MHQNTAMAFQRLDEIFAHLGKVQVKNREIDAPALVKALRTNSGKKDRELWHAFLLAYAYTFSLGLKEMRIQLEPEDSEHDATLQSGLTFEG